MRDKQKTKQRGFSLMELMIALTIIGIIAVVGMKFMGNSTDEARKMQAFHVMKEVQEGIAVYYMKTGYYPELGSWEAMISPSSPLFTRNLIRRDIPVNDPWGNPYEGKSTKLSYELKCAGRPDKGADLGPITMTQNGQTGAPGTSREDDSGASDAAPAQEGAAQ